MKTEEQRKLHTEAMNKHLVKSLEHLKLASYHSEKANNPEKEIAIPNTRNGK